MTTKFYDKLSNGLTQLLENPIDYNVTLEVCETPVNQTFKVHSYILQSRCPYFKKKFNENNIKVLKMYIYGGTLSLENLENSIIFDLLTSSHELELDELVENIQTHLVTANNASWLKLNFAHIYQTCYKVKNFDTIQKFCNNIIAKHPNTIFESENFISLPEDIQESTLPANLDEWTSDNFITLKTTLKNCLSHVRYLNISREQVLEKLYPYLQLFEPKLWLDINTKLLSPEKPISSTILHPRKILNALELHQFLQFLLILLLMNTP
ncbi:hypothetical protein Glove_275g3 [Diversispora epigaea]|uniref:BTB domain-containing protein n=1 Tax=Diversispora epigaea TaxID=1348612 RepID=A0A397I732_9GLOM|nr:hypothetical protein Glove_275g3 [Diversispora epigaea]